MFILLFIHTHFTYKPARRRRKQRRWGPRGGRPGTRAGIRPQGGRPRPPWSTTPRAAVTAGECSRAGVAGRPAASKNGAGPGRPSRADRGGPMRAAVGADGRPAALRYKPHPSTRTPERNLENFFGTERAPSGLRCDTSSTDEHQKSSKLIAWRKISSNMEQKKGNPYVP